VHNTNMKYLWTLALALVTPFVVHAQADTVEINESDLPTPGFVMYHLETCQHCRNQLEFLPTIQEIWPDVNYQLFEVQDQANAAIFAEVMKQFDLTNASVPTTVVNDNIVVQGFNQENLLQAMVNEYGRPMKAPVGVTLPEKNPEFEFRNSAGTNVGGIKNIMNIVLAVLVFGALGYGLYSTTKSD